MEKEKLIHKIPKSIYKVLEDQNIEKLRPAQHKSINAGLFEKKNLLVCTPTASGKTLVAEMAFLYAIEKKEKAVYIVPLKALAQEKYKDFKNKYKNLKIALSIGDLDSSDSYLGNYDLIIATSEKLDSLIRHNTPWLASVGCVIIDEIHLLNDVSRGPTLEILITILRQQIPNAQLVGLSATIGNPNQLAEWLDANLVEDSWRPVKLEKGILFDGKIEFY